jgi:hypothetical protein
MATNRYTILGYLAWQGGKWYLRKRLPSARALMLSGAGGLAAVLGAAVLAKRLAG